MRKQNSVSKKHFKEISYWLFE